MKKAPLTHLAIIMDGNRRWAKSRGLASFQGHEEGYKNLRKIADHCLLRGIKIVTVFAFSTENWQRSKQEVSFLLALFLRALKEQVRDLHEKNVKVNFIGHLDVFPVALKKLMEEGMELTRHNTASTFNIAVNYGGRDEILRAVKAIISDKVKKESVSEEVFSHYLYTENQPDPELVIRTSGEQRLSGFLPWQAVYSELYFTKKNWPEFSIKDLDRALIEYVDRQRRFGK